MPSYFIEMGQGIIAKSNDLHIATSALFSCTFIAGLNEQVGYAGAFHYPAGYLKVRYSNEYPEGTDMTSDNLASIPLVRRPIHDEEFWHKNQVVNNMTQWVRTLRPTRVVLVYGSTAHNTQDAVGMRLMEKDANKVKRWVLGHCPNAAIEEKMKTSASMLVSDGQIQVRSAKNLDSKYIETQINLQDELAGSYSGYTLFGKRE